MKGIKLDGKKLRQVAGAFATGVTVVTIENETGEVVGMTANSFVSVSLDPPLVSFCVTNDASIFPLIEVGKPLGISILRSNQKVVSNQFAGFNEVDVEVAMTKTETGGVIIDKALAWYSTVVHQIIPAGDHHLIMCEIRDLDRAKRGRPLIYFSGYRTTGTTV